jgi:hypothetical protein
VEGGQQEVEDADKDEVGQLGGPAGGGGAPGKQEAGRVVGKRGWVMC